jgi:hypothetical protein
MRVAAGVATLAAAVLGSPAAAHAQAGAGRPDPASAYQLVAGHSEKCLDVAGGLAAQQDGAVVQQWDCNGQGNQHWTFVPAGDGYYNVIAAHSGKCLDVTGGTAATANAVRVQQWSCNGGDNQRWRLVEPGGGAPGGKDGAGGKGADGAKGVEGVVYGRGLLPLTERSYALVARHSGKALDVLGGTGATANGAPVQQLEPSGGANQRWRLTRGRVANAVAHAPARGCFRVTLAGFAVSGETVDHALEYDGKRDEVFVRSDAWTLAAGRVVRRDSRQSVVMGDVNNQSPARVQAGGASDMGGIRRGDRVPGAEPWRLAGPARRDRLPLHLWEGELVDKQSAVAVMPTIWEWDGGNDLLPQWTRYVDDRPLPSDALHVRIAGARPLLDTNKPVFFTSLAGDRPIGVRRHPDSFRPQTLVLTFAIASEVVRSGDGQNGAGVVAMHYSEAPMDGLDGDYTLYLVVEEVAACGR